MAAAELTGFQEKEAEEDEDLWTGPMSNLGRNSELRISWTRGASSLWEEYTNPVRNMNFNDFNAQRLLDCVEDTPFQVFMQTVIVLNVIVLWWETDYPTFPLWTLFDNIFLWIFIVELVLRITHKGPLQFILGSHLSRDHLWNLLDLTIVVLGIVDLWVAPLFASPEDKSGEEEAISEKPGGDVVHGSMLRFLRMLRLLRLARVFKMVRPLTVFAEALGGMLAPVAWFLTMLFLFNFIFSIVLTDILKDDADEEVSQNFSSIGQTFFTLFQITTTDNWIQIAEPVIRKDWKWQFFFVAFIAFASWTMISILTAVACDNMICAMEDRLEKSRQEGERKQKEFIILLRKAFHESDKDSNGLLDREELEELLESHSLKKVFEACDIQVQKDELKKRFEMLDVSDTGVLTIDEFVEGLAWYQEGLSTKHIVNLDYSVRRLSMTFEGKIDRLELKVSTLRKKSNALLDRIRKQNQVYLQQHMALHAWQEWALQNDPKAFPSEFLAKARQPPPWLVVEAGDTDGKRSSDLPLMGTTLSMMPGAFGGPRNAI
mmetsp:Transcript_27192/g.49541  ORF Transcript_27192/g.49541 Transcript_27192/m.49541 type:complete len:545 (-) Transcript_27192:55-1689(-)